MIMFKKHYLLIIVVLVLTIGAAVSLQLNGTEFIERAEINCRPVITALIKVGQINICLFFQ